MKRIFLLGLLVVAIAAGLTSKPNVIMNAETLPPNPVGIMSVE